MITRRIAQIDLHLRTYPLQKRSLAFAPDLSTLVTYVHEGDSQMSIIKKLITPTLIVATLGTAVVAASHVDPAISGAMKARTAHMGLYGFNLAPLGAMAKGEIAYDAATASAAAQNLAALANMDQSAYWVAGSDTSVEGSRAKPEIFSDPDGYMTKIAALGTASTALAAVAGDGLDAMKAAFGPVGAACGDCHETYRAPRS